jgi:Dullard-like phosphatase family protein
MIGGLGASS